MMLSMFATGLLAALVAAGGQRRRQQMRLGHDLP